MKTTKILLFCFFVFARCAFGANIIKTIDWETGNLTGMNCSGNCPQVNGTAKLNGNYGGYFELTRSMPVNYRTEVEGIQNFTIGTEYWLGHNFKLQDWAIDSDAESVPGQIHSKPSTWGQINGVTCALGNAVGTAPVFYMMQNNKFQVRTYGGIVRYNQLIDKTVWHSFVVRIIPHYTAAGVIEVWLDGTKIVTFNGANMPQKDKCGQNMQGPYLKLGIYKWNWQRTATQASRRLLYIDNVKIASGTNGYTDVFTSVGGGTPPADTTAPVLSAITSTNITTNSATITFTSDESSDTRVDYGTTTAYGSNVTNAALVTAHSINITGLAANTTYNYKVTSADASANSAVSGNFTFTTLSSAPGPEPTASYRINAGGPLLADTTDWSVDTSALPSPYVNAIETTNKVSTTTATIDMTHASIVSAPPPMALFQKERYDPNGAPEMEWIFPTESGSTYTVNLYFAETFAGTQSVGARKFDVTIEGVLSLDDYDIFAEVGANKAIKKTFDVISDGNININFGHVVENPKINGIEIFKINDTTPPVISNIQSETTTTTATVTWQTDEAATSRVKFFTPITTSIYTADLVNSHSILIENLQPGTTYTYKVTSVDEYSNLSEISGLSFVTQSNLPPVISSIQANNISDAGFTATWVTDTASNTVVNYGLTTSYGQTVSNATLLTSHSIDITGLSGNTEYHYRVCSTDANNLTSCSLDQVIQTDVPQTQEISNIVVTRNPTSLTIAYTTSQSGDTTIRWGLNSTLPNTEYIDEAVTSHSKTITGLSPNTRYYFKLGSVSVYGFSTETSLQTYSTKTESTLESDSF